MCSVADYINKTQSESWSGIDTNQYSRNQKTANQTRRGSLQLWQFLVSLLDDPNNVSCIMWTGRGTEFKLVEPEEVFIIIFGTALTLLTKISLIY